MRLRLRRPLLHHPAQVVVLAFLAAIVVGTVLLMLPAARTGAGSAPLDVALFTSTSAVCVTGLIVVDTPSYWSGFGEVVILALIQLGGLGIMTFASLLGLLVTRRMGLRTRLTAAAETKSLALGEVSSVVKGVVLVSVLFEAVTAVFLTLRFLVGYDASPGRAAYLGVFHSVSAFNNAGFALYPDNLMRFVDDPWICLPISVAVIAGGLGFPVILEIRRQLRRSGRRRRQWSLHTRMTVSTSVVLLVLGTLFVTSAEWGNSRTLGALDWPAKMLAGFFQAVVPRTAGFNTIDYAAVNDSTLLGTSVLMFIGGGSAGTAGGIKVTTFVLLLFVIVAEVRGERRVNAFDRQISPRAIRQALTVVLLAIAAIMVACLVILQMTRIHTEDVLFEVVSAFGTVGLSTGITADLPGSAQMILVALMFLGRLGPITLVSALAYRDRHQQYELPEGRPIIG